MQMILLRRLKFGLDYNFHFTFVVYEEDYLQTEKSTAYPGWVGSANSNYHYRFGLVRMDIGHPMKVRRLSKFRTKNLKYV